MLKIALMCGGPSLEKGISLNSARSVLDHLAASDIEILPIYLDTQKKAYQISVSQLYSNTPSDFDFKLQQTATPLTDVSLLQVLKSVDIVFPVMHGPFGEDGELQSFLERHQIPFVGSGAAACGRAFDKYNSNVFIYENGFFTRPSMVVEFGAVDFRVIQSFFDLHAITRAVVKPANGGSSIGVFSVATPAETLEKVKFLFDKKMTRRVVIEPFAQGVEFTTIILENRFKLPVALPPTEIETDYTQHQIFDFRRKYLPSHQVTWHCPPRFDNQVIEKIQAQAEQIFALFGMRDFARFDGWVLPDGNIWFCDFNPISGMEQNSFLFQQASRIGMTHTNILRFVLENACRRYSIPFPPFEKNTKKSRKPVQVLFGGAVSERQVSLMSGTNIWLKLRGSSLYKPQPFLLDAEGYVWKLPYHLALNHTVEEITENCKNYPCAKALLESFEQRARFKLGLLEEKDTEEFFEPQRMTLESFMKDSTFIFSGLHGGAGEDGTLQALFAKNNLPFNGSDARVSRHCMDKWVTAESIRTWAHPGVSAMRGRALETEVLLSMSDTALDQLWTEVQRDFTADTCILKPRTDGCSTGIVHLYNALDFRQYVALLRIGATFIPKNTFKNQSEIIDMPPIRPSGLLIEKFIETDKLSVKNNILGHTPQTGWVEMTVGVLQDLNGAIRALSPSITIAEGEVLTVEEKFQGGTGVNITPPPTSLMSEEALTRVKGHIQALATHIGISGYARIDTFVQLATGDLQVIEINTLPGLTPSTVFYHQGLCENPPLYPQQLLEQLIANKGY